MAKKLLVLISIFLIAGCSGKNTQDPKSYSKSLLVPANAVNILYSKWYGTDQVAYSCIEAYPAAELIRFLDSGLKAKGWEPLTSDFLNPKLGSVSLNSWRTSLFTNKNERYLVYERVSQWTNSGGDMCFWFMRYRRDIKTLKQANLMAGNTGGLSKVDVNMYYWPKKYVQRNLEVLKRGG